MAPKNRPAPKRSRRATGSADVGAVSSVAGAAGHEASGTDAEITHGDARTTRDRGFDTQFSRENADINVEEQAALHGMQQSQVWAANSKRTYDLHQTWDADQIHAARGTARRSEAYENRSAEATLLHQSKMNSQELAERQQDHAQRVRFADSALTVQVALLTDMAEKLSRIEAAVCNHGK